MNEFSQEDIKLFLKENKTGLIYLYTPLCGTCQMASKILTVTCELLPNLHIAKANLNYAADIADILSIESVPCLVSIKEGQLLEKIYAFHSVPYLYEKLKDA
ncbi:thioredoxin family protein [Bacillus sp. CGMCC 1.16607]|uniref:thioredoxin family protein n=1 Tax=Bacillus sp. CGMCC 1.16607 TaxID=3351842 RepID=UPI0036255023